MTGRIFVVACVFVACGPSNASMEFDIAVTNALNQKSCLVSDGFTNYMWQCANQNTNAELSLSAHVLLGVSQLEMFDATMKSANLGAAFQSVSNALSSSALTTNQWQYWHLAILHIACLNTANNTHDAYLVASNAWDAIHSIGFVDSTNVVSRALLKYHGVGTDVTIRSAIALNKALSAAAVGKQDESNALKVYLPDRLKQEMETFLSDE
ncbi:MAG: hypothetical protein IKO72_09420 [Kiritimatiellae bacterium]|nr:hypothetical protein [Kiritimatiellia bacterium]